jgi:hypothetical protein
MIADLLTVNDIKEVSWPERHFTKPATHFELQGMHLAILCVGTDTVSRECVVQKTCDL